MAEANGQWEEENTRLLAAEREPCPPSYRTPEILWRGPWRDVADILGIYDFRVWVAVAAALSARAHRNLHVNYHKYLYGMNAYLLVAPSGVGKALVTDICQLLLPKGYNEFDSVESGQALLENLAWITRDKKGKILLCESRPTILITSEWSQLLKTLDFHGSTLLERIHKAVDGERSINLNRADKHGNGKIRIERPTLTILGTTTVETYLALVKEHHMGSGWMNRHLILPTENKVWRYNEPNQALDYAGVEAYGNTLPVNRALGNGRAVQDLYAADAWAYDDAFGESFLAPLRNGPLPHTLRNLLGRLHVQQRRIALLYAWALGRDYISLEDVQAAAAVVRTSYDYLMELHGQQVVELTPFLRARGEIEELILARVTEQPGIRKADLCHRLRRHGGYSAISEAVDRLVAARALEKTVTGGRGQVCTLRVFTH